VTVTVVKVVGRRFHHPKPCGSATGLAAASPARDTTTVAATAMVFMFLENR
jgi:hypothetical protein